MGSVIQKISQNKKNSCTKFRNFFFRKIFEKIWIDLGKNIFEDSSKTLSNISVPNFEAVGHCSKPIIEPALVMTLVLSHKLIDNRK